VAELPRQDRPGERSRGAHCRGRDAGQEAATRCAPAA
jgi:hypothetical protein